MCQVDHDFTFSWDEYNSQDPSIRKIVEIKCEKLRRFAFKYFQSRFHSDNLRRNYIEDFTHSVLLRLLLNQLPRRRVINIPFFSIYCLYFTLEMYKFHTTDALDRALERLSFESLYDDAPDPILNIINPVPDALEQLISNDFQSIIDRCIETIIAKLKPKSQSMMKMKIQMELPSNEIVKRMQLQGFEDVTTNLIDVTYHYFKKKLINELKKSPEIHFIILRRLDGAKRKS
jgi:hypothetical protein